MENSNQKLLWIAAGIFILYGITFLIQYSLVGWFFILAGSGLLVISTRAAQSRLAAAPLARLGSKPGKYLLSMFIVTASTAYCCWAGFALMISTESTP